MIVDIIETLTIEVDFVMNQSVDVRGIILIINGLKSKNQRNRIALVAQLDRASHYGCEGYRFESFQARIALIVQLDRALVFGTRNVGSNPARGT